MADKNIRDSKNPQFTNSVLDGLKNFFGIGISKNKSQPSDMLFPTETNKSESGKQKTEKVNFDSEAKQFFDWYLKETKVFADKYKNREAMYDDLDALFSNCPIVSKSAKIVTDEIIQADSNNQLVFIDAKRPVKKFIQEFFDDINLNFHLKSIVADYVKYGNAGLLLDFNEKGVCEIIPISPRNIKERIEFNASEIQRMIQGSDKFIVNYRKLDRVNQYIDDIMSKESSASFYKNYLLGFQIGDRIVPPWKFIHFRNMSNDDPFKDFGIPLFINSMAPYRQYDAAMTLQITARSQRFPKQVFKLKLPNTINPLEKLEKATEFMNEYMNSGMGTSKKEMPGVGDTIVTIEELFEYDQITPDIDLGKIDDIEMLYADLLNSVPVPRNLIDPNDSAFGDSGISLVEKFKPFARLVFSCQSAILEQLTMLVKIHMICSGQFSVDDVKFTLSMPYPESQTNRDIIDSQSALLTLANDVIQNLQDKIVGGDSLPPEIIRQIYTKFLPYDDEVVNQWIDDSIKAKEEAQNQDEEEGGFDDNFDTESELDFSDEEESIENVGSEVDDIINDTNEIIKEKTIRRIRKKWKLLEKDLGRQKLQEQIENEMFDETYKVFNECIVCNRHLYSSKNNMPYFRPESIRKFDKDNLKLLKEEEKKNYYAEEINYKFKFKK